MELKFPIPANLALRDSFLHFGSRRSTEVCINRVDSVAADMPIEICSSQGGLLAHSHSNLLSVSRHVTPQRWGSTEYRVS